MNFARGFFHGPAETLLVVEPVARGLVEHTAPGHRENLQDEEGNPTAAQGIGDKDFVV